MSKDGKLMDMLTGYAASHQHLQANIAAPFFAVVEMFKILGLRDGLLHEVQAQVEQRRVQEAW